MSAFTRSLGRRQIHWTDHSLDRWWERWRGNETNGRKDALRALDRALEEAVWQRSLPPWHRATVWDHGRTEGFVALQDGSSFPVVRNPDGARVATTFIARRRAE